MLGYLDCPFLLSGRRNAFCCQYLNFSNSFVVIIYLTQEPGILPAIL